MSSMCKFKATGATRPYARDASVTEAEYICSECCAKPAWSIYPPGRIWRECDPDGGCKTCRPLAGVAKA
jgi:hypothetical protein